nr:galactoside alpha-(1,2)-fucosyltransferase 2-like [Procambarus clarkii]
MAALSWFLLVLQLERRYPHRSLVPLNIERGFRSRRQEAGKQQEVVKGVTQLGMVTMDGLKDKVLAKTGGKTLSSADTKEKLSAQDVVREEGRDLGRLRTEDNTASSGSEGGLAQYPKDYLHYEEAFSNTSRVRWPLMVFSTMGQLGNCLNSYATALTFHGSHSATVAVTQHIFGRVSSLVAPGHLTLPVVSNELLMDAMDMDEAERVDPDYLKNDMVSHLEPTFQRAVAEYRDNAFKKVFILEGYPNRMRMLADHHHVIRSNLRIRPELQAKVSSFLDRVRALRGDNITFVGVHVRRGDYVRYMERFFRCKLPQVEFIVAAMDRYRATVSNPVFVVCSDDLPFVRLHLQNAPDTVISDMALPEEDMALLAACSHSIMTVGSFGFWGSYLAGGRVIYPLLNNCFHTPFVHPDTLGPRGFENWLAIPF